ncbi:MAG: hypothetical protein ACRCY4_06335, partial [Brevinema sp.]
GGTPYRDLFDTAFIGEGPVASTAILIRRVQEFVDPYYIPAPHANANEALLTNVTRQVQANSQGVPVTSSWRLDALSNFTPLFHGPTPGRNHNTIAYDFNPGDGTANGPGESYNINVNIAIGNPNPANSTLTNAIIGRFDVESGIIFDQRRAKFLVRTIEANAEGTEGVVRFYYGRPLGTGGYNFNSDGVMWSQDAWDTVTNQNVSVGGWQLSNRYLAIKIGTGPDTHTAKFVWGNTAEEAKRNLNALPYYNIAAHQLAQHDSRNTLRSFERPTGVPPSGSADKRAWSGKFVVEDPASDYTIYADGPSWDAISFILRIWKDSEKPANQEWFNLSRYQYKEIFRERNSTFKNSHEGADGVYVDVTGTNDATSLASGRSTDGTRVGVLTGFGPLSGSLIRIRAVGSTDLSMGTADYTANRLYGGWAGTTDGVSDNKYIRIARTLAELTNDTKPGGLGSWKKNNTPSSFYNATLKADKAY